MIKPLPVALILALEVIATQAEETFVIKKQQHKFQILLVIEHGMWRGIVKHISRETVSERRRERERGGVFNHTLIRDSFLFYPSKNSGYIFRRHLFKLEPLLQKWVCPFYFLLLPHSSPPTAQWGGLGWAQARASCQDCVRSVTDLRFSTNPGIFLLTPWWRLDDGRFGWSMFTTSQRHHSGHRLIIWQSVTI